MTCIHIHAQKCMYTRERGFGVVTPSLGLPTKKEIMSSILIIGLPFPFILSPLLPFYFKSISLSEKKNAYTQRCRYIRMLFFFFGAEGGKVQKNEGKWRPEKKMEKSYIHTCVKWTNYYKWQARNWHARLTTDGFRGDRSRRRSTPPNSGIPMKFYIKVLLDFI